MAFTQVLRLFLTLALAVTVLAAPVTLEGRASITVASSTKIASITPYAQFARAAYCMSDEALWTCGDACSDIPDFVMQAGGGDGNAIPRWFVGYSPSMASIIVVHEGTDPTQFLSLLNDAEFFLNTLDKTYFPGISNSLMVHNGFQKTFQRTAASILAAVKAVMKARSSNKVTLIGHSLGGALAILDSVYLKIQIPTLTIKTVTLGVPRVGNGAFADYLSTFDLMRISHNQDPIPIVPGRLLGFRQPQGEIHQSLLDGKWYDCPDKDNTDIRCSTGAVPNLLLGNIIDHLGPYNGVWMGTIYC